MSPFLKIALVIALCIVSSYQQSCSIIINQDINLPDLAARSGQPQSNCCNICQNTQGCQGFAWNGYEGGTCWLKAGKGPLIAKDAVNVGILVSTGSPNGGCSIRSNQDINLPDLAAHYGQPQENCCNICGSTPGCKGFAWNAYEGGTCWLKSGTAPLIAKDNVNVGIMGVDNGSGGNGGGSGALVSYDEFANAVVNSNGYPRPSQAQYNAFIQGLPNGLITMKQEAAMALAHFLHESDGLRAKREYRCQDTGCPGEYVTSGCDVPGQRYFGRGYIQLTWCYNYRAASQDLFKDSRLVSDADMVARDENLAWNTAFWFWKMNVHNVVGVAQGDFGVTTRAINGNLECNNSAGHSIAKLRYVMYGRIRAAWGLSGPGQERGCYN